MSVFGLPLVRSKLLVPVPAGLLHRPRVCQVIERGLACKLTLLSAPAGYGKTSALVDFAQHTTVPVCWYTADERDRDLELFVAYLVGAIDQQFSGFAERVQATLFSLSDGFSANLAAPIGIAECVANELFDLGVPLAIVIDTYEAVDGAPGIREFTHRLLQILPPDCHLMLGSRVLPDVPVTQLVASRQLVGLAGHDLCFTPQEIQDLLQLSELAVSEAQAHRIAASSEGWITGILLLTDLLREDALEMVLDAGGGATAETYGYLATEVLNRQSPDVQQFLRTSSVLREMSVSLCRQVLHIQDPRDLLAELERRNLFVTRFGRGAEATFRYHNLFRDFLHQQLQQRDPARALDLHRRAAAWFDEANDVEEAVYHYLCAEAHAEATALMEQVAREWFVRGRVETLLDWAQQLPDSVRSQAPRLLLYQSKVLGDRFDLDGARRALLDAERGFGIEEGGIVDRAAVLNHRAFFGLLGGRYEDAIADAQDALEMLDRNSGMERANALRCIGKAYLGLGRFDEGLVELQEALTLYRQIGSPYDVVNCLQDLGSAFGELGRLDKAATHLNEALTLVRRLGASVPLTGTLNNLATLCHLRGEYQEALAYYEEGLAVTRRGNDVKSQAYIYVGMADLYRDLGAYERAGPLYDAARPLVEETAPGLVAHILLARADTQRWQGDPVAALALLREARRFVEDEGLGFESQGLVPVAEGIALAESGEIEAGIGKLSAGVDFIRRHGVKGELGRAYFLLARARLLAGDAQQAVAALRRAMKMAKETGTYQFAVVEGRHAPALLELGVAREVMGCREVVERLERLPSLGGTWRQSETQDEGEPFSRLRIFSLGEARIVRNGRTLTSSEWKSAKAKELFFYILLHGPLERDAIGSVFWPELPAKRVRNNFHATLYRVRRAVGSQGVITEGGQYRVGEVDYWFDVEEFEGLIARARLLPPHDRQAEDLWKRALALYQGDFLLEVERTWCVARRESLHEMYIEALVGLGRCYEARRAFEDATEWYGHALEADALREDVCRRLMRCYEEMGQRNRALEQYHRCEEVLERELGLEPAPETRQLYNRLAGTGSG